jgi:epoxyqueuosine reductase
MSPDELFDPTLLEEFSITNVGYTETVSPKSLANFKRWVDRDDHEPLKYLGDERALKRDSIHHVYPGAESVLVFAFNYSKWRKYLEQLYSSSESNGLKIASYVFGFDGFDYHHVLREALSKLAKNGQERGGVKHILGTCLDIEPVLERDLGFSSGLGWYGKNSMLINRHSGSYFLIGSLILGEKLSVSSHPLETDHCGHCTACVDHCPTDAIDVENRTIVANKCISTYTIEIFKDDGKPPLGMEESAGEIFGCDICQDVCPWNKKSLAADFNFNDIGEQRMFLRDFFLTRSTVQIIAELESMSNREYRRRFKSTPLERTGRVGMLKNLRVWNKQKK